MCLYYPFDHDTQVSYPMFGIILPWALRLCELLGYAQFSAVGGPLFPYFSFSVVGFDGMRDAVDTGEVLKC